MYRLYRSLILTLSAALLLLASTSLPAFEIDGSKWPTGETEFYVDMTGTAPSGITWNAAFIEAMNDWSTQTSFNFIPFEENRDPCLNDGWNSVDFSADFCGTAFGSSTLAVAVRRFTPAILGEPAISEANIVIDQNKDFDVYDGTLVRFGESNVDFRRVALHELGHVIGLDHESSNLAIMAPSISNLDRLQPDDIAGAEALYDGSINCAVSELTFGTINNALGAGDCKVSELLPGSSDISPIDLYRFTLNSPATLSLGMTSATLDSVLLIADEKLQVIGYDDKASNECDSTLTQFLQPGTYFLLANTYDVPVNSACGVTGDYQISAALSSPALSPLGNSASLSGAAVNASFSGGISANGGISFSNQFSASASVDISGRIDVDPIHVGQAGFLVVAAIFGEQTLFLNAQGQFVDASVNPGVIVHAADKTLASSENLTVVENLVPAALGVTEAAVSFYFGYGLTSASSELYYHLAPLNFIISP